MAAEVIYKIFVSSTYEDLREERAQVQKALLKLKCLPVGMELFPSTDEETWEFIKRQIQDCDYYVVLVAGRYGSVAPNDGRSFTEMEYDYAREVKKPILAFVHAEPGKIEADKTDFEPAKREKLAAFIDKIKATPLVNFFSSPHELAGQVLASVVDLRDRRPGIGFIRADQAGVEYKKYAELLEENANLKTKIEQMHLSHEQPFDGNQDIEKFDIKIFKSNNKGGADLAEERTINVTWATIFKGVSESIITNNAMEYEIANSIPTRLVAPLGAGFSARFANAKAVAQIKMRLFGLQLIYFDQAISNFHKWDLTDHGQRQYGLIMNFRQTDPAIVAPVRNVSTAGHSQSE